nr:NADH dehydrogenase [ubiquinone] 1 beta subcomplex subunit 9-like [Onthophagus taurus]
MTCSINLPTGILTHTQMVKSLYKRVLRNLESWYDRREVYRYQAVLMRARFERNKSCESIRTAQCLLQQGEEELFQKQHWYIKKFCNSVGGTAFQREVQTPDWAIDHWHPLEKMQYPEYFKRREEMKRDVLRKWERANRAKRSFEC